MITLSLKIGSSIISGPTFSIIDQVDIIHAAIYGQTVNTGFAEIWYNNSDQKGVFYGTFTENLATGLTLSIVLQSDDATEIDPHHETGPTACGIKDVTVEWIQ